MTNHPSDEAPPPSRRTAAMRPYVDDRGRPIPEAELFRLKRSVGLLPRMDGQSDVHWTFVAAIGVFTILALFGGLLSHQVNGPFIIGMVIVAVIATGLMLKFGGAVWARAYWGRCKQIAADRERCPACSFTLRGLIVHEDGCRLCPECGGAWRAGGRARPVAAENENAEPTEHLPEGPCEAKDTS